MSRNAIRALCIAGLAAAMVFQSPPARAVGTTGKLSGRVVNEKKEPLAGVNIRVEGLKLGAATDDQGNYFIIGVPAGTYNVRADLLGHAPYVAQNVQVIQDFTTTVNMTMREQAIQLGEVRVESERPLLQKDATGTTRFISSQDIQNLPTRGYRDAAAQQTGVVNFRQNFDSFSAGGYTEAQNSPTLIVRGGRPNETAYYVDGFSQQDPLTGSSNTEISNNAIQEVVVLTGGFNPEYGRVMSGAVNVVTREGTNKYSGTVETVSDVLSGNWIGAPKTDYNIYDLSFGGPVVPGRENLTFYVSGERRWQGDRQPTALPSVFKDNTASIPGFNGDFKPSDQSSGWTYQGKLNWQPTDHITLKAGGLGSTDDWRQFVNFYLFNLDHAPRYLDRSESYYVKYNQVLNRKTFFDLSVNYNLTQRKRGDGVAFDNLTPRYQVVGTDSAGRQMIASEDGALVTPTGYFRTSNPRFDLNVPLFWNPGHVYDDYLQRRSEYDGFNASFTSQVTPHHQMKAGGDFQYHTLRFFEHYFPSQLGGDLPNIVDWDGYGYNMNVTYRPVTIRDISGTDTTFRVANVVDNVTLTDANSGRDGAKHPKVWSLYVQDKYEQEGVIVNGGLRYDYLNVDTPALLNPLRPLDPFFTGSDTLGPSSLTPNKVYSRISPRIGVAFPVTAQTIMRFNYGQFYQQPNLQDLYVSYRFLQHKVQTGGYFVGFGNPNLRPEHTTAYEVGIAHELSPNVRLDVTAYYKDVKDLVEITNIASFPNQFSSFRNRDYATIKGVDLGFKMRPVNHLAAEMNYSLSYAYGTGSVSQSQRNIAWTAAQPPKQTAPLDFDQRHKISLNLNYSIGRGEGWAWRAAHPFENTTVNVLYNVASGLPYTPSEVFNEVTLAAVQLLPSGPINSRYGPWTNEIDVKATKGFNIGGFDLEGYVWVLNLLNTLNPVSVYSSSGSPNSTGWLTTEQGQQYLQAASAEGKDGELLYQLAQNNPNFYSNPRLVRFGIRANF